MNIEVRINAVKEEIHKTIPIILQRGMCSLLHSQFWLRWTKNRFVYSFKKYVWLGSGGAHL